MSYFREHLSVNKAVLLERIAEKSGIREIRKAAFKRGGKTFEFKHLCNPDLNYHASWWSMVDEEQVRNKTWHISQGDVVLDVGAAYGSYGLQALAMGAERLVAWSPEEYDVLVASLHENGWQDKADVSPLALWSEKGWLANWSGPRPPEFFLKQEDVPKDAEFAFAVSTIDEEAAHLNLLKVDWMKLDVEGCEVEIIKGATETIRKFQPKILVENHLFKDPQIGEKVNQTILTIMPDYTRFCSFPYHSVSHTLYLPPASLHLRLPPDLEKLLEAIGLEITFVPRKAPETPKLP